VLEKYIGEKIKDRRKLLAITQHHLAELAGVSVNTLYKIERGQANPTIEVIGKIFEVLGLTMDITIRKPDL
jgi:transcriptional regulator with XRE-family HTH domain